MGCMIIRNMMRLMLCLLFVVASVLAAKTNKRTKPPFIADAVGNILPPPSVVPATIGSPVNLLTPDRYEFYTFDESGELVKRLMTLEEIQAIVAAGEDGDTPVTFDSDDNPTIAFNFTQPSNIKVHSVVTNVQNVLKAQMEAHKNKPLIPPTLDTPDVSDSWSLILPSIFGNTGVDIMPENSSGFTTPETETFIIDSNDSDDNLSKEGIHQILSSSTASDDYNNELVTEKASSGSKIVENHIITTTTITKPIPTIIPTTNKRPTVTTTTRRPTTTTTKPITTTTTTTTRPTTTTITTSPTTTTTTTKRFTTTKTTTTEPTTTTTEPTTTTKLTTTTTTTKPSTTVEPTTATSTAITTTTTSATTKRPKTSPTTTTKAATTTTKKPSTSTTVTSTSTELTTPKRITTTTTRKPTSYTAPVIVTSTDKDGLSTKNAEESDSNFVKVHVQQVSNILLNTERNEALFEKISTFIPVSTVQYVTERSTYKPIISTKQTTNEISETEVTEKAVIINFLADEKERTNATTITTQSVSPFIAISSTEMSSINDSGYFNNLLQSRPEIQNENNNEMPELPMLPLFDVAQSISQIASDLGGNYQSLPTTSNLLDTTKYSPIDLESKEDIEMDIPSGTGTEENQTSFDHSESLAVDDSDHFVQISTLDPHSTKDNNRTNIKDKQSELEIKITTSEIPQHEESTTISILETTMDPVLSGSMNDLLFQVVNQAAQPIVDINTSKREQENIPTTMIFQEPTTEGSILTSQSMLDNTDKVEIVTTTEFTQIGINNDSEVAAISVTNLDKEITDNDIKILDKTESIENPVTTERTDKNLTQIPLSSNNEDLTKDFNNNFEIIQLENNLYNKERTDIQEDEFTTDASTTIKELETTTPTELTTKPVVIGAAPEINNKKVESKPANNKIDLPAKTNITKKYKPTLLPKIDDPIKVEEFKKKIQKVNVAEEELISERNNSWKLISTGTPPRGNEINRDKVKLDNHYGHEDGNKDIILEFSKENQGLEVTTKDLEEDIAQFTELCNELAFRYWDAMIQNIDKKRSFVISPYSITSLLAMIFMGARGSTSGEMNEILKLDDMVTFNPHFTLKNISDSIETTPQSGIIVSAFIRELYSDRNKGKILTFYKERAQHFYNGHVEEINFKLISDIIRRRTNLLVKRFSWGRIPEFMKTNTLVLQPPLAAFSANIFQTDCTGSSVDGRDGEMYFVVSPNVRQRRLVPVPAVVYKAGFLAGYDPVLDATAAAIGTTNSIISTLFLMPGQQGNVVHADDLEKLEQRMLEANPSNPTWNRLLRTLLPRVGLELQIPRFSHKSIFNVSSTLKEMGLKDLFDAEHADLGGLNGPSKDLYLSDMIQSTTFVTCGEGVIGEQHHIEEYPEFLEIKKRRSSRWVHDWDEPRDYQRAFHDPHDVGEAMNLPLHLRPRQARLPSRSTQPARLKYDRPFLYFVRHNPSGMVLYVGRFNPRLLP
ncbi:hypothetical protein K1T71_001134 [Dendrolimus kikuchii]|uniref:Uncharacterized protein n=1 Tax=Dendrolimus kikuchii TaxID=765133 RepID=A0ACC1DGT2_9NEOP|nr:hypothetical protein K1T71_001134 [Dendrolimus kikuchii]